MTEIITFPELENRAWPSEFSGAWGNIILSIIGNRVFSLYFNNENPEGTIFEDNSYLIFPDAYVSIRPSGEIFEIYVKPKFRRNKIGEMLCKWTRTNFINDYDLLVKAPEYMNDNANRLYSYISRVYNEPYNEPGPVPLFDVYTDFGGIALIDLGE